MRTDGRPDFVEWVHGQVDNGVVGADLVTAMETRLRTYDSYVPAPTSSHRRYTREAYAYAYEPDYVPVIIRGHCERLMDDPLALLEMPVAVTNACDLGLPYDRVSGLVVELNLGGVPALQFVEVMRYAPAALVGNDGYYGQPDFVQFVRTRRMGGVTGYPLVMAVDQQLRRYDVAPQIDLTSSGYGNQAYTQAYAVPPPVQNYVAPVDVAYVPAIVHTRVAANVAAGRASFGQPGAAVVATPQVQRLLGSPNGAAVVANPAEARRELARGNRTQREAPVVTAPQGQRLPGSPNGAAVAANPAEGRRELNRGNRAQAPVIAAPLAVAPGRIENHGRPAVSIHQPAVVAPSVASVPRDNGRGRERVAPTPLPTPMISSAPPAREQVKSRAAPGPPPAAAPVLPREQGRGHAAAAPIVAAPAHAPAPVARPQGHSSPPPAAGPPPPRAPAPEPEPPPPGQEKKKEKGKD
jgi:hypothetical protein